MCFGFRISSPLHLSTFQVPIQNLKCPKNSKNTWVLLPRGSLFRDPGLEESFWSFGSLFWAPRVPVCPSQDNTDNTVSGDEASDHLLSAYICRTLETIFMGQRQHRSQTTQFKLHLRQLERKSCVFGVFIALSEMCSDVMGSKFWIQNTCGKLKKDLCNWF